MFDRLCPLKEAARDTPRGLALLIKGRSFSFSELDQESDRLALLLHRIGIQPGSRIAVFHPPDWRLIALFFALWRLGATLCPLNLRLTKVQIEECLFRLDPALYLTDLEEIPPSILPAPCFLPSPSLLLFTSGSTGTPKIAALNLSQLLASAQGALKALDLCAQDQWLLTLPLYHVGGIGILIRCILARATLVLDEKSPHITHLSYVPTQLYHASPIYPKLRCLLLGGASISSYPSSLPIYLTYGLTEMSSLVALRYTPPLKMGHYYLG
ncbi:MAG: AMP-binding protein, partial [Chlamydiota bacterium]